MSGDGSLGYWSHKTIHSSSRHLNDDDEIYEEECIEVYLVDEICGNRSLGTIHSYPSSCGGCGHRSFETSHSSSSNHGEYHSSDIGRGGYRLQDTSQYSSINQVTGVDVEGGS